MPAIICEQCREHQASVAMKRNDEGLEAGLISLVCVHCCYRVVSRSEPGTFLLSRITR